MTSFKIYIGEEIRRFSLANPSYETFLQKLCANIPSFHAELKTMYEDSDKEKVVFSCEVEFQEMLCHLRSIQNKGELFVVRIWIQDSNVPYFKDGTQQVVRLYTTGKDAIIEQLEDTRPIQERITSSIARLFPNGVILPYHVPSFLSEVIAVKANGPADAEIDVTVDHLARALNHEALRLMDSQDECDLTKSKLLLESLSILTPEDPNVYYNLACAESLLKNAQSSIEQLQTAFKYGYNNLQHMYEDKDLCFLRVHSQFQEFVQNVLGQDNKPTSPPTSTEDKNVVEQTNPGEPAVEQPQTSEVKVEEPEKVAIPEVVAEQPKTQVQEPAKWGDEIEVLRGMGFQLENSVFIDLLDHHKGDVGSAVQGLI